MADPNVTSVVIDGVEHWGSPTSKWARNAPKQQPAPAEPVEEADADAAEDAAPRPNPKSGRSRS